jgi:hypothetical protein
MLMNLRRLPNFFKIGLPNKIVGYAPTAQDRSVYTSPPVGGSGYEKPQSGLCPLCGFSQPYLGRRSMLRIATLSHNDSFAAGFIAFGQDRGLLCFVLVARFHQIPVTPEGIRHQYAPLPRFKSFECLMMMMLHTIQLTQNR